MTNIKYDDVLTAADAFSNASADDKNKLRWALENAITSYAQVWADEQKADLEVKLAAEIEMREFNSKSQQHQRSEAQREKVRADNLNTEAHELSEKLIVCRRENKELKAQCEARNREQNSLEEQKNHNAECCYTRDEKIKVMEEVLQAARLLCANLDNGGVGHKSLVENFRKLDEEVK